MLSTTCPICPILDHPLEGVSAAVGMGGYYPGGPPPVNRISKLCIAVFHKDKYNIYLIIS